MIALFQRPADAARLRWVAISSAVLLSGCSTLTQWAQGDRIDYRSAQQVNQLEVPPDLTQLSRDPRFQMPGRGPVTAAAFQAGQRSSATAAPVALQNIGNVRLERAGSQRWLVVQRPPEQLWQAIRDFWQENGFVLTTDSSETGIMETDWAENRAKIPQDFIRNTLGRLIDQAYDTGERDRFRTRLERTAGGTEIYVSHRGMVEVVRNNQAGSNQTVWQPKPPDPELEADMLARLMVKLGVQEQQARAVVASAPATARARAVTANGVQTVQLDEDFDRAWRRVGLALDRTGFTVEDRDRSQGVYFVRYIEPNSQRTTEPGFFGRLFGRTADTSGAAQRYRIAIRSQGAQTTVSVLNQQGTPETGASAQRIVTVLVDELK